MIFLLSVLSDFVSTANVLLTKPQLIALILSEGRMVSTDRMEKDNLLKSSEHLEAIFTKFYWP